MDSTGSYSIACLTRCQQEIMLPAKDPIERTIFIEGLRTFFSFSFLFFCLFFIFWLVEGGEGKNFALKHFVEALLHFFFFVYF